jgi:hypothetical protein
MSFRGGVRLGLASALLLGLAAPSLAGVLAPDAIVAGKSQNDWAEQWWQWATDNPPGANPIEDLTGEFAYLGDQGDVFFLAGGFGPSTITRTISVQKGQHIFFPLINAITWREVSLYDDLTQDLEEFLGNPDFLYAELDGVALVDPADLPNWLQQSPDNFDLFVRDGDFFNSFGVDVGVYPSQQRGWWLMLTPLKVGSHTLRFGGSATPYGGYDGLDPLTQDITYRIQVVPEPSAIVSMALGGLCLSVVALRRRWRSARGA